VKFSEVIGQKHLKSHLQHSLRAGRIPHAQLFSGNVGSGLLPMALAYAAEILTLQFVENSPAYVKGQDLVKKLEHPDLHFVFPVNKTKDVIKDKPISDDFMHLWRSFVIERPYSSLFQWLQYLGIENKQGNISVHEAQSISHKLALKSFHGGYKVMIIWMAEHMNEPCANKILKLIEEPEDKTVLLLLSEREDQLLTTIRSRLQELEFPLLSEEDIANGLIQNRGIKESTAHSIASRARGDFNRAIQLIEESGEELIFEEWFISWVRIAFRAKDKKALSDLLKWSENLATIGRESQKKFLLYCLECFRQALMQNYGVTPLVHFDANDKSFQLRKFAPFIHGNNIVAICNTIEDAAYHIERNANPKVLFADLSMKLTRFLHREPQ